MDSDYIMNFVQDYLIKHISNEINDFNRILFNRVLLHKKTITGDWNQAGVQIEYDRKLKVSSENNSVSAGTLEWESSYDKDQSIVTVDVKYNPDGEHKYNETVEEVNPHQ